MTMQMFKELFNGKYDGKSPETLLPTGSVSNGENMRKVGEQGGWKTRKGATLHNTTQISAHEVKALLQYTHPRNNDYHFFAQINSLIYNATNDPNASGTTFGTSMGVTSTTTPAFWDTVREHLFIGDGGGAPLVWGGDSPFCTGFLSYVEASYYVDFTQFVTDNRSDTNAVLHNHVDDELYVCSPEIAKGINITLGTTKNDAATVLTVKAWRSGAWVDVTATDGTDVAGDSFKQTGNITWTEGADEMRVIENQMGYWYQLTWTNALDNGVQVTKCQVQFDMVRMTNKWNSIYEWIGACRLFNDVEYEDHTGDVTNESTSVYMDIGGDVTSTGSYIYVKAAEPITGIGFGVDAEETNVEAAVVDLVESWDGDDFATVGTLTDGTKDSAGNSSFAQSGTIYWNASGDVVQKRTFSWDSIPGYWYRVSWDAELTAEVRIWGVNYIPYPKALATTNGCVEFKGRLFTWGDPEYPNRLRYSAKDRPDCFCGTDSRYTEQMGDMDEIRCVRRFYNELLVWKKSEVYLLEGYSPQTFGALRVASTVGIASPQSAHVVETGSPTMHKDEPLSVAIWQDIDGIYLLDGRKPKKISLPIDEYFNVSMGGSVIAATEIKTRQAFIDKSENEYHFLLSDGELVYNYITDEWFPPWAREEDLSCGLQLRGTDDRWYTYGGLTDGYVMRLENGTVDKDTSNTNKNIASSIKTRAISTIQDKSPTNQMTFRKSWVEAKSLAAGTFTVKIYPDLKSTGTTLSSTLSLVRSGYDLIIPGVFTNQENITCFQMEFSANNGIQFEIHTMLYQIDGRGEISVS